MYTILIEIISTDFSIRYKFYFISILFRKKKLFFNTNNLTYPWEIFHYITLKNNIFKQYYSPVVIEDLLLYEFVNFADKYRLFFIGFSSASLSFLYVILSLKKIDIPILNWWIVILSNLLKNDNNIDQLFTWLFDTSQQLFIEVK